MMLKARTDKNQPELVKHLRSIGFVVSHRHGCHKGVPDIEVGFDGYIVVIEIKDPEKPPSARRLTKDQIEYFKEWVDFPLLVLLSINGADRLKQKIMLKPSVKELTEFCKSENSTNGY